MLGANHHRALREWRLVTNIWFFSVYCMPAFYLLLHTYSSQSFCKGFHFTDEAMSSQGLGGLRGKVQGHRWALCPWVPVGGTLQGLPGPGLALREKHCHSGLGTQNGMIQFVFVCGKMWINRERRSTLQSHEITLLLAPLRRHGIVLTVSGCSSLHTHHVMWGPALRTSC